LWNTFEKLTF
jgi:hypothetical protein